MRSVLTFVSLALVLSGCANSPIAPAGSVSVTAPFQAAPANGAQIANVSQPVTLTIANALVTGTDTAVTYTFEVATDATFLSKVATKTTSVDSGGRTSVVLDTLTPGKDYFWHARATGDDTVGAFSPASRFTIGPMVTLETPIPVSPRSGTAPTSQRPTLTVTNAPRNGPAGAVVYRFEIATSSAFSTVLVSATVPESTGPTTSFTPATPLAEMSAFFWRAQASAPTVAASPFSFVQNFNTSVSIDLATTNYQRFVNVRAWPRPVHHRGRPGRQHGQRVYVHQPHASRFLAGGAVFRRSHGHGDGHAVVLRADQRPVVRGRGRMAAPIRICKPDSAARQSARRQLGGPMTNWRPRPGDLVGFIVSTPAQSWPAGRTVDERTNVVVQPWVDTRVGGTALRRQ